MKLFRKNMKEDKNRKIRCEEPRGNEPDVYSAMGGMIVGALFGGKGK